MGWPARPTGVKTLRVARTVVGYAIAGFDAIQDMSPDHTALYRGDSACPAAGRISAEIKAM